MKPAYIVTLLATLSMLGTASAAWQRLPSANAQHADTSSKSIPGTSLKSSTGISQASALLSGDATLAASLQSGASEFVVQLSNQLLVDNVTLVNDNAEGKVTVSGSSNGKDWTGLSETVFSETTRLINLPFAGTQVKYLLASFQLSKGGSVRSFSIRGAVNTDDFWPIYVHPSPINIGEKEFDVNVFKFPKTKEKYRTVIYDLGGVRQVKTITTSYTAKPVRIQAFGFQELPEKKDWRGKLTLDETIFDQVSPSVTIEDALGEGNAKLVASKTMNVQYVAVRFEPYYNRVATNGNDWSEFVAFAMEPYKQAAVFAGLNQTGIQIAGDNGAPFNIYDISFMGANGLIIPDIYGSGGSGPGTGTGTDGTTGGQNGGTDSAGTTFPGPPGFNTGSFNSYTNSRSAGGVGSDPFQTTNPDNTPSGGNNPGSVVIVVRPRPNPNPNPAPTSP